MKLILFPLVFLVVLSIFSQLGIADTPFQGLEGLDEDGYYDETGYKIMTSDHVPVVSDGGHEGMKGWSGGFIMAWFNSSGSYALFTSAALGATAAENWRISFSLNEAFQVLGLVVGIIALGVVVGLRVLGSGISDESVSAVIKGSAYMSVWAVFSVLAFPLMSSILVFGTILYFFLTVLYCLGTINSIGHPSGGD